MKIKNNTLKLTLLALSMVSTAALAEGYIGFGAGQANFGDVEISGSHESVKFPLNQSAMSMRAYVGYNFNPYFGAEIIAGNINSVSMTLDDETTATIDSIKYISLQPKVMFPLNDKFNVFAKAGAGFNFAQATGSNEYGTMRVNVSTFSTAFGLGAEYLFTDTLSARLNWEYTKPVFDMTQLAGEQIDVTLDINQIYAGINYRF